MPAKKKATKPTKAELEAKVAELEAKNKELLDWETRDIERTKREEIRELFKLGLVTGKFVREFHEVPETARRKRKNG